MAQTKRTELLCAYLVVGDDALKREAVMRRLRERLERLGDLSFNLDVFDGVRDDGTDIVNACVTIPFASEKRLVQVNAADKLNRTSIEVIVDYLEHPSESTVLLLVAEKLAKNSKLYKAVAHIAPDAVIDCASPKSYKMAAHVRAMAPTHGITLTDAAAARLIEAVGTDTVRLDNELKKLALAHESAEVIDVDEIEANVSETATVKPWVFVDAFAARDLARCIALLPKVEDSSPLSLLSMCVSRIRELMCAKAILSQGGTTARIAQELNVADWKVKHHTQWASRFSDSELRDALKESLSAEQAMKSGTSQEAALLEWFVEVLS